MGMEKAHYTYVTAGTRPKVGAVTDHLGDNTRRPVVSSGVGARGSGAVVVSGAIIVHSVGAIRGNLSLPRLRRGFITRFTV